MPAVSPSFRILPLVVAAALFMENMDGTVIATSLPAIAADLGTTPVSLKLAFTTYLLALTIFLPVSGWVADRFGARRVFRAAIVIFTAGSMACGFAHSLGWLVAARFVQGMGGAMMVPVGRVILLRTVPKAELVDAMAWLTVPALIGPLIGPPVGGFITTYFDWRWIFWMNLPFGLLAVALATRFMPNRREKNVPALDVKGFILSGLGLALTVFGLTVAGRGLIANQNVAVMIVIGLILVALYIRHAKATPHPILDLKLLKVATYRISIMGGSLYRIGMGAIPFLLPLMLQLGFGLTAFQSGLITCASAAGAILMKFTAGRIIRALGFRPLLIANGILSVATIAVNGWFAPTTPVAVISGILLLSGFFRSLQFTSLNAMAYSDIDNPAMSRATALFTTVQQLSLALGVAIAAYALEGSLWFHGRQQLLPIDFTTGFLVVAAIAALSVLAYVRLPVDAGAAVSGKVNTSGA
jgi:EmrB/QacA subfamily drug resistance transporter